MGEAVVGTKPSQREGFIPVINASIVPDGKTDDVESDEVQQAPLQMKNY